MGHRVGVGFVVILQLILRFRVIAQHFAADLRVGIQLVEARFIHPRFIDMRFQLGNAALSPQQFSVGVVNKHQRWRVEVEIRRNVDAQLVVAPLCQAEKEITFAAQQTVGGFIETHHISDDCHQPVGQRQGENDRRGRHHKTDAKGEGFPGASFHGASFRGEEHTLTGGCRNDNPDRERS